MKSELDMLNEGLVISKKMDKVQAEYNAAQSPYFRITLLRGIGIFLIIMLIIGGIINSPENPELFKSIGFVLIFLLIISNKLQSEHKIKNNQQHIDELQKKYNQLSLELKNVGIHEQYCYTEALEKLIKYLKSGRADNLKEALNLFETDIRHDEQMNKLNQIHKEQQRQLEELKTIRNIIRF